MFQARSQRRRRVNSDHYGVSHKQQRARSRQFSLESLESRMMLTGTWTPLAHTAPASIFNSAMILLSDGTAMIQASGGSNTWYRLSPDSSGSYVNGNWSTLTSMSLARSAFPSNMLPDGRVFVFGGEYSGPDNVRTDNNSGEIYDPVANSWTAIASYPAASFGDGPTVVLSDGRVLAGDKYGAESSIYDPATNTWTAPISKLWGEINDEETWVKLPDGSVLSKSFKSPNPPLTDRAAVGQRFDPTTMSWIPSGATKLPLGLQNDGEMGPGMLLPDGHVFQIGANGNTALYTPPTPGDGTNNEGSWANGPSIPGGLGGDDSPAAMLPNGHVLLAAGATPGGGSPTKIFEFDPIANSLTDVTPTSPNLSNSSVWPTRMLMLPSGQVLFAYGTNQLYVYTPNGAPNPSWKPTITNVAANGNHFTLTGTQLNGLSAGANYGDDAEMDSNYPIVELTSGTGQVYFARTSNWNSTGVQTGSLPVSTDFSLPTNMPYGNYSLSVIANGIASDPVPFTGGFTGTSADLAITYSAPGVFEGNNIVYTVVVTNKGPTNATGVVLSDTLDAGVNYVSVSKSQGSVTKSGNVLTFSMGSIAAGKTATATITVQTAEDGNVIDAASVTGSVFDADTTNNSVAITTAVPEGPINVSSPITVKKNANNLTVATFTHANGIGPASAFVATIDWGDGITSTGAITLSRGTYSVQGSHTYTTNGSHTVTTTVVESENTPHVAQQSLIAGTSSVSTAQAGSGQATSTDNTATAPVPPAATPTKSLGLTPAAVDHVFGPTTFNHTGPAQNQSTIVSDSLATFFAGL